MKEKRPWTLLFLYLILTMILVVALWKVGSYLYETYDAKKQAKQLEDTVIVWQEDTQPSQDNDDQSGSGNADSGLSKAIPASIDFEALLKQNDDVVAWIYCPDTEINYPIVQAADNDYYLRRGVDGGYARGGTLFMDFSNSEDFSDLNTIIYGHNMKNGTMFGNLKAYMDEDYYEKHSVLYLYTPQQRYVLELVAGCVTDTEDSIYTIPGTAESRDKIIKEIIRHSDFASGITLQENDRLVTLSTCSYEHENSRYVLVGRLVENSQ